MFSLDVSQLVQGGITAAFNGVVVLLSGRFVMRGIERIEKRNGNDKKGG
jgi:hypothetical protein